MIGKDDVIMATNVYRFSMNKDESGKLVDLAAVDEVVRLSKKAVEINEKLEQGLASLNVSRGGANGLKGFICEQLEASARDGKIRHVYVIDDNGLADLVIEKGGKKKYVQVKCGYKPGQVDWSKYKDMDVVYINRDNPRFAEMKADALKGGVKKVEATVSTAKECDELGTLMKIEAKITGNPKAVFVPHAYTRAEAIKLIHLRGVVAAKACAKVGGAVAIGTNFVDVITGEKTISEAVEATACSTAESALIGYAGNAILSTAVGQVVKKVGSAAAKKALGAIATTEAGAATLAGITAAEAIVTSVATDAVLTGTGFAAATVAEVGGVAASTASALGATGAAATITTVGSGVTGAIGSVAALATPLAPVAAGAAITYGAYKIVKKIF